jgi:L-lactate utilization protein LutC
MTNPILEDIRRSLERAGRESETAYPADLHARAAASRQAEIDLFLEELRKIFGVAECLPAAGIPEALRLLVTQENIHKAAMWQTNGLKNAGVQKILEELGVTMVAPGADKNEMASCELGITEADFLLPETGTVGLLSSGEKPQGVSLLPRVRLVIADPRAMRADLG